LANFVAPVVVSHATQRNERRAEALRDMYAAISMAVVAHAILSPLNSGINQPEDDRETRIQPWLMFNMDAVSILIGNALKHKVRVTLNTKKNLQNLCLSVGFTKKQTKERGIKQYYITRANDFLTCAIIVIKDNHIKEISSQFLHDNGGYECWVIFVPNRIKKIQTNTHDASNATTQINHRSNTIGRSSILVAILVHALANS
jgi:hypothetical protein